MKKYFLIIVIAQQLFSDIFSPIPKNIYVDAQKVAIGKKLFNDPILSKDNTVSSATCHPLSNYGVDGLKFSVGINGNLGNRNTPTVFNSYFNFRQMWDGKAKTLNEQAVLPITNKHEMGETLENIVSKLKDDPIYNKLFNETFENGVSIENITDSLSEFQKQLITPDSKFDLYLRGQSSLSKEEMNGYQLFISKGCASCHNGINIGGNNFQKLGYFIDSKNFDEEDLGRYHITKNEDDKKVFKVPSLRNVAMTGPYLHDGKIETLYEAVKLMSRYQLGIKLNENEIQDIILFLQTLTGKLPDDK